ncbi:FHA domain-containing protein [Sanguibacter antarcticus]|uniref:FHA domain-containing protein n=2 Tax=Sanguibacter antarcticus TaxID=372484 RepID=A0A2A9E2B5_9MICO|nr:FHA domain-containing protein [Sanguibacter antarcticus]
MTVAPVGRRVAAFAVDLTTTAVVTLGVYLLTDSFLLAGLALVEVPVGLCVWEGRSGLTVGNALLRVRTVRADGPFAPGIAQSAVRGLVVLAGFLVATVGQWVVVASGAWDRGPLKQGWHDSLAKTTMIDVSRRALAQRTEHPADEPVPPGAAALSVPSALGAGAPGSAAEPPPTVPVPVVAPVHSPQFSQALPSWAPPRSAAPEASAPGPAVESLSAPPRRAPAEGFLLSFDNGQSFTVHGSGLVGRRPRSAAGERHDDLLVVDDDLRSVSKTHLEFGIDDGGFWVTDRGSTNGTSVLTAHGEPLDVAAGARVHVPADGSVRVGRRQFTARALTR